jgi:hypothetical protein
MLNYQKMFEPYTLDGCTLEMMINWVQGKTKADERIMDQAVAETMNLIASGVKFDQPCACGCGIGNVHTAISHFLLSQVAQLQLQSEALIVELIENRQKLLVEAQMKQLSGYNKREYIKLRGGFLNKLKKFVGLRYNHWDTEIFQSKQLGDK